MRLLFQIFLFTAFSALMFSSCNQKAAIRKDIPEKAASFPDSWLGSWEGDLNIYKGALKVQSIPMEMKITAADSLGNLSWSTKYKTQESIEKPYTLKTVDLEKGWYLLDENNSIKIETYRFDNKLVSWYEVQGTMIQAAYEYRDGQLIFEILAGKSEPASITGGTKVEEEEIPAVKTWPLNLMQRAILQRK